jgi:hypothetical protein
MGIDQDGSRFTLRYDTLRKEASHTKMDKYMRAHLQAESLSHSQCSSGLIVGLYN